ncbi:collectin-11-like [Branchiostoma lanceolatum]|uniref:collectin-11-like n=1 Tax=Branchiostoma lanceolatum TaxID=7740 RepID=UPI00345229BD
MNRPKASSFLVTAVVLILLASESAAFTRRRRGTCSAVNCQWGPWTSWSSCTAQCGTSGTRTRTRAHSPAASCGGASCSGSNFETEECNRFCPNGTPSGAGCDCTGTGYTGTCCDIASCSELYPGLRPARNFRQFRNQCFWSSSRKNPRLNYTEARQECGSHGGAGTLVMIKDAETQNFLKNHLKRTSGKKQGRYWIGLDDLNSELGYKWNDETLLGNYDKFRSDAPHKIRDCVILWRTRRRWENTNCSKTFPYICQLDGGS